MASIETLQAREHDRDDDLDALDALDALIVTREPLERETSPHAARPRRWMRSARFAPASEPASADLTADNADYTAVSDDAASTDAPQHSTVRRLAVRVADRLMARLFTLFQSLIIWLQSDARLPRLARALVARLRAWLLFESPLPGLWRAGLAWLRSERPLPLRLRRAATWLARLTGALAQRVNAETPWGSAGLERTLSLRQKALRAGSMALLIGLTLYLLLNGPALTLAALHNAGATLDARLHPPKLQPTLAERGYQAVKSPPFAYNLSQISIAPVAGSASTAWACWASPFANQGTRGVWSAMAYRTADGGESWRQLTLPQTSALGCKTLADPERPASALIVLAQGLAPDGSCIAPFIYLTTDAGQSWKQVVWPLGPSEAACSFQMALQGGAIYAWSPQPLVRGTNPDVAPTGRLLVTRDAGATWALADNGLDDNIGLAIVGFRPGGRILATIANARGAGASDSATLMTSDDYGATWRNLGVLPGAFPQVFVSNDGSVTDHGGWGRLYELAEALTNGSPTTPQQLYLATSYIGQGWTPLPLPPLGADIVNSAQSRQPLVVGLGPAGSLEVERGIVDAANSQLNSARLLWVWNPARSVWLLDPQVVPGNLEMEGVTWRAGDQIYWMTTLQLGVPPVLQIYTKTYPADVFTHFKESSSAA